MTLLKLTKHFNVYTKVGNMLIGRLVPFSS